MMIDKLDFWESLMREEFPDNRDRVVVKSYPILSSFKSYSTELRRNRKTDHS
jgi:hypothetical protein